MKDIWHIWRRLNVFIGFCVFWFVPCDVAGVIKNLFHADRIVVVVLTCLRTFVVGIFGIIGCDKITWGISTGAGVCVSLTTEAAIPMFVFRLHGFQYYISVVEFSIHSAYNWVKWSEEKCDGDREEGRYDGMWTAKGNIMRSIHFSIGLLRV